MKEHLLKMIYNKLDQTGDISEKERRYLELALTEMVDDIPEEHFRPLSEIEDIQHLERCLAQEI